MRAMPGILSQRSPSSPANPAPNPTKRPISIVVWVRLTQATVVVSEPSRQILSPKGLAAKWYSTDSHQQTILTTLSDDRQRGV